jgi:hypothetical protein
MALIASLAEDPKKSILKDRVFCVKDPVIGNRVNKIAQKGFLFKTEERLDFCKLNTLDNKVSKEMICAKAVPN